MTPLLFLWTCSDATRDRPNGWNFPNSLLHQDLTTPSWLRMWLWTMTQVLDIHLQSGIPNFSPSHQGDIQLIQLFTQHDNHSWDQFTPFFLCHILLRCFASLTFVMVLEIVSNHNFGAYSTWPPSSLNLATSCHYLLPLTGHCDNGCWPMPYICQESQQLASPLDHVSHCF